MLHHSRVWWRCAFVAAIITHHFGGAAVRWCCTTRGEMTFWVCCGDNDTPLRWWWWMIARLSRYRRETKKKKVCFNKREKKKEKKKQVNSCTACQDKIPNPPLIIECVTNIGWLKYGVIIECSWSMGSSGTSKLMTTQFMGSVRLIIDLTWFCDG